MGDNAAYRTLDGEFHQAIIGLCGNSYLIDAYAQVAFRTQALRSRLSDEAALNRRSLQDHSNIVKLVRSRHVPALLRLLRAHIRHTMRSYLDVLERRDAAALRATPESEAIDPPRKSNRYTRAHSSSRTSAHPEARHR